MSNLNSDMTELDDFYLSPKGSQSAVDYYESFLKYKDLVTEIPTKIRKDETEFSSYQLLKEVHSTRTNNPALYRRRPNANEVLCTLWISRVKSISKQFIAMNEIPNFQGISPDHLIHLSKLSSEVDNLPKLASILFDYGIILIYESAIPGMKLDGAVFLSESGNPVIAMSLRYKRLDIFWFTLMHELAHISLHIELLSTPIFDNLDEASENITEKQADRLALNSFVSRSDWRSCEPKYDPSNKSIIAFAKQMGVHPAIIAGRLNREMGRHDLFTEIINSVNVRKVLLGDD